MNLNRVEVARFFAKNSVTYWNRGSFPHVRRAIRVICRIVYREMAEADIRRWERKLSGYDAFEDVYQHTLYGDPQFSRDEEYREGDVSNLFSDRSSMVVRYATSYCALMIRLATGKWPQGEPCDAKYWLNYLKQNGFTEVVERPLPNGRYIGILPSVSEHGLVVWCRGEANVYNGKVAYKCYTYANREYCNFAMYLDKKLWDYDIVDEEVTWVKII